MGLGKFIMDATEDAVEAGVVLFLAPEIIALTAVDKVVDMFDGEEDD